MSRDAFSHDPQDTMDTRDTSTRRSVRQHRATPPDARDGRNSAPEASGRGDSTEVREQQSIHANSAQQGLARFTSCVLQSGVDLPYRAIKTNIADSLNVVIHVERRPGRRYISEVLLINRYDPDADLFDYGAVFLAKQDHP